MKPAVKKLLDTPTPPVDRRAFFTTLGLDAAGTMALTGEAAADAAAGFVQSNVNRASEPSALKITDLRVVSVVGAPFTVPLIRIDTNQGLVGWGEVRDGSHERYALFLKSRILGAVIFNGASSSAYASNAMRKPIWLVLVSGVLEVRAAIR